MMRARPDIIALPFMFESIPRRRRPSRPFVAMLFGIALSILARSGVWLWPGWPARTLLDLYLGSSFAPSVAGPLTKGLGLVALLVVNAGFWAVVVLVLWSAFERLARMIGHR